MSKIVYNYQEIGTLIDQGKEVAFTRFLQVRVTAIQQDRESNKITVTMQLIAGEYVIAVFEREYPTIISLLDAFDIGDLEEIWELLEA